MSQLALIAYFTLIQMHAISGLHVKEAPRKPIYSCLCSGLLFDIYHLQVSTWVISSSQSELTS